MSERGDENENPEVMQQRAVDRARLALFDELVKTLGDLEAIASLVNARQNVGCEVRLDQWSKMFYQCNEARIILAKARALEKGQP